MVFLATALLCLSVAAFPDERRPEAEDDVITLTDGKTHTGQVVYSDEQVVILRNRTREREFSRDQIEDIDSRVANLAQLLQRLDDGGSLSRQPPEALLELANFAEHSRLPGEARLLRLSALLADPEHEAANEALGNVMRKKKWTTRRHRDWVKTADLDDDGNDWKDRWTLDTAHYRVSSNLPLGDAIAAAIDLERLYAAYFQLLAQEVGLREPRELMEVQLHGDEQSFPEPGSGRNGSFTPNDRVAYVSAVRRPWHYQLAHECTRQLLFVTTQRAVNGKGEVPRWLDAGLAEAFATGISGRPGQRVFDPLSVDKKRYAIHANSEKPFGLRRVQVFNDEEMNAHQWQSLRFAQCYTLVNFLMQGDASAHREGFYRYLRDVWAGRASPSRFEEDLAVDDDELQELWSAAARRIAGV